MRHSLCISVHNARAELALWAVVGVYFMLAMRWSDYTSTAMAMI